jgi:acyl carrier protein phosphodiesterase
VHAALQAYKEVHGDLQVPYRFVVPSEVPWPEEAWGMKLGNRVDGIRSQENHVKHHPERRAELDALGFVWDDLERRWEEMHAALLAYHEVHGDLEVPQAFVVPSEAPWPEEAWGMKLGKRVNKIRNQEHFVKDHPERRAELDALGFVWDDLERRWEKVHAALLAFKEVHGDLEVPQAFVVPSEAPWPEEAWGVPLGYRVSGIRSADEHVKHHPERRAELDALGFVWDEFERRWEEVHAALLAYKEVHGDLEVSMPFVVPSEAPWPEEAGGMKLGGRVSNIRSSQEMYVKHHPERRAELRTLGFRWNSLAW